MIVWGGEVRGLDFVADGAAYDPAKDEWRVIAPSPLAPRSSHAAFWTGTEMIVWGGEGALPDEDRRSGWSFTDGAAYNPATDTWRLLPQAPLRAGQGPFLSVVGWTGDEMIVWGGFSTTGLGLQASVFGARYDPATDRWQDIAITPLLDRAAALGGWSGTHLVVWGGVRPDDYGHQLDDGAAYDPATDSWHRIADAPQAASRSGTVATFVDGEMIVVGNGVHMAYDPGRDHWREISPAPQTIADPTLIDAGSQVLLWGGGLPPEGGYTSEGYAYDPDADVWTPLPDSGLPGRQSHAAVWTGSQMLVWGGFDGGLRGDGGAYDIDAAEPPPITHRDESRRFSIAYPALWYRAESPLTPNLADPVELVSVATFPLAHLPVNCAQFPTSAIEDLGPSDALVTMWEWEERDDLPDRPPRFPTNDRLVSTRNADESPDCLARPKPFDHWWITFEDAGREFQVYVAMGREVSGDVRRATWEVLNSFTLHDQ